MTVWSIVEPVVVEARYEYPWNVSPAGSHKNKGNTPETAAKCPVERAELEAEVRRLVEDEGCSIREASIFLGHSPKTVRSTCRTLKVGTYAPPRGRAIRPRSSQVPFGWELDRGLLKPLPEEMKWVRLAQRMRKGGASYHAIARHFEEKAVPTKNGGHWHAKSVSQILSFNEPLSGKSPAARAASETRRKKMKN